MARRTAFGSLLITLIKVRAAPDGTRVPSSHFRTVPTAAPMKEFAGGFSPSHRDLHRFFQIRRNQKRPKSLNSFSATL
jgi:hypothetical protein